MHLSESLMRNLLNSIKGIPSKIAKITKKEVLINPAYRDVEHSDLCLSEQKIWVLRADHDITLALGIQKGLTEKESQAFLERFPKERHSDIDMDNTYGHPSLAVPDELYAGHVYYAGWIVRTKGQIRLLLSSEHYPNHLLLPLQKKLLEVYIAFKLMSQFGEQVIFFIEQNHPDDLVNFCSENWSLLKEKEIRSYTPNDLVSNIEKAITEYSISILRRSEQFFGGGAFSKTIADAFEDTASWLYQLPPYRRQYTLWTRARGCQAFTERLLNKMTQLNDHVRLTENDIENLLFGVSIHQPLMQAFFMKMVQDEERLRVYSHFLSQIESRSFLFHAILNDLAKNGWLDQDNLFRLLSYDDNKMFSLRQAIDVLSDAFQYESRSLGQSCIETLLKQNQHDLDPEQEDVIVIAKAIKTLLKTVGTGQFGRLCLKNIVYHPDIRRINELRFSSQEIESFKCYHERADQESVWRPFISREKNRLQLTGILTSDIRDRVLFDKLSFDFAVNGQSAEGLEILCRILEQNTMLKEFALRYPLQSKDATAIANLVSSTDIEKLDLSYCNIDSSKAKLFVNQLSKENRLSVLDLSGNPISDEGIFHIVNLISKSSHLKFLKLTNCKIGDQGLECLASIFPLKKATPTTYVQKDLALKTLWIDSNHFHSEGILAMTERALTLQTLHLGDNHFSAEAASELIFKLPSGSPLTRIDWRDCHLDYSETEHYSRFCNVQCGVSQKENVDTIIWTKKEETIQHGVVYKG